jgi:hypothetical protein
LLEVFGRRRSAIGASVSTSSKAREVLSDDDVFGFVELREGFIGRFTADGSED